jgi:hypothetical protein
LILLRPALYGDVTIADEGLQNLGLCSALRAFEQGGIFIATSAEIQGLGFPGLIPVSSEGPPHTVVSYDTQGDVENLRVKRNHNPKGKYKIECEATWNPDKCKGKIKS